MDRVLTDQRVDNQLFGHPRDQEAVLFEQVFHRSHQRVAEGRFEAAPGFQRERQNRSFEIRLFSEHFCNLGAVDPFHQYPPGPPLRFDDLPDLGDHANFIDRVRFWLIVPDVFLCDKENPPVGAHHGIEREDRLFPPYIKMQHHLRIEHQPTQHQHRHFDRLGLFRFYIVRVFHQLYFFVQFAHFSPSIL